MTQEQYQNYIKILRSELIPAMGCTEPIAVAFAAASPGSVGLYARSHGGAMQRKHH